LTTINLNARVAKSAASLIAVAADRHSTPLFQVVRVEIKEQTLTAIATDKYSLAVANYDLDTETPEAVFYLDAAAVKFISGIKLPKYGFAGVVSFEIGEDRLTVAHGGTSVTLAYKSFEYPAPQMLSLVEGWQRGTEGQPFGIDPSRFASFAKILDADGNKISRWVMNFGQSTNGNKPAPLRLSAGEITLLTQPAITN
jgi:hypothetical protein